MKMIDKLIKIWFTLQHILQLKRDSHENKNA